mgnify:CR=1 FL=1|tara:strand:+ start:229 stop:471 length:243 start_codon:yes stop_codon:yes gene_type:complete
MEQEKQLLEVRIFITAMLLQELLDETYGNTKFKGKMKRHINGLIDGLEDILSENINDNALSLYLTQAAQALDDSMGVIID